MELEDKAKEGLCGVEFPAYDGAFYVPDGFVDISFAKDVVPCPSIMDEEAILTIRQDFADPKKRVMKGGRYRVDTAREELMESGYEHTQPLFSTEDFQEALDYAKKKLPALKEQVEEYIAEERREKILSYDHDHHDSRNPYDDFLAKSNTILRDLAEENSKYLHKDDCTVEAAAMMLLEKKYSKGAVYRAFRDLSPLTTYPGKEEATAKSILEMMERDGVEKYVAPKFLAHLTKDNEAVR